jgi:nucleolar protein 53
MGRKLRGAALRAHKRGKAHAKEIIELKANLVETAEVAQKSNEELFLIDTSGDMKAVLPKILREKLAASNDVDNSKKNKELPKLDQAKVELLIKKHDPKQLQAMAKAGQAKLRGDRNSVRRSHRNQKAAGKYDLWGKEGDTTSKQTVKEGNAKVNRILQIGGIKAEAHVQKDAQPISKAPKDAVAVDVAHAGQSYRPDPKAYLLVVQDALSLELRRRKAEDSAKAPLATGMSPETRALLVGDSDTSDDQSEADEKDTANNDNNHLMHKRQDKYTRAERNKQKRLRQEKAIQEQERQRKKLLNSIAEIPRYKKEIKKQAKHLLEKKEKIEAIKSSTKPTPGKNVLERVAKEDPINVPTLPVALEEEHKDSSLRTIKPKGSLVTDRMASFADRKLVNKKRVGERKRIKQGKRRKLSVKGKGHDTAKAMDYAMMG